MFNYNNKKIIYENFSLKHYVKKGNMGLYRRNFIYFVK